MKNILKKLNLLSIFLASGWLMLPVAGCGGTLQTVDMSDTHNLANLKGRATMIIKEGLGDNNPEIKVNAIEAAADIKQMEFMPEVKGLIKDDFVPVRFAAALAVGDCEYNLARKTVEQLLEKAPDENTKIAAAYALFKLGSEEHIEFIREAIKSKDMSLRANAVLLLGKSGDKDSVQLLRWVLNDRNSDDKVQFQAAEALARLGDEEIYSKLWTMLISAYADDRVFGIGAMGSLGIEPAKNALITMLADKVLEVRLAAAEQLGKMGYSTGEPEVLDVFTQKLTSGLDAKDKERIYLRTALAIGQVRTAATGKFLPQLLANESKFVRIAAAKAVFQYIGKN